MHIQSIMHSCVHALCLVGSQGELACHLPCCIRPTITFVLSSLGVVLFAIVQTGRHLHTLTGHQRPITSMLLLPSSTKREELDSRAFSLLPGDAIQATPPIGTVMDWLITASSDRTIQVRWIAFCWNISLGFSWLIIFQHLMCVLSCHCSYLSTPGVGLCCFMPTTHETFIIISYIQQCRWVPNPCRERGREWSCTLTSSWFACASWNPWPECHN